MSSILSNLTTSEDIGGEEKDSLGGRQLLESGIYKCKIDLAYAKKSDGGALGLFFWFKTEDGKEFRWNTYVTNKQGQNYYTKDGEKFYLPGFNLANSIAMLTTGKEISALEDPEDKVVNLYDNNTKAEIPTKVAALTELMGQEIYVGVVKQTVNKQVKDAAGVYQPTAETRDENDVDKFFCAKDGFDKLTSAEIRAKRSGQEIQQPFFDGWLKKNQGKTINKVKEVTGSAVAGAPKAGAPAASKPTNSLFG